MLTDTFSTFILPLDFSCIVYNDNRFISNIYEINLGIDPSDNVSDNIGIGFQRIKFFTNNSLQGSLFIPNSCTILKELDNLQNNIIKLPCEAYDIYIGSILMTKFQAISTEYFDIQFLSISSLIGDHVQYNLLSPFDVSLDLSDDGWWNQNNVYTGSKPAITWDELNLTEVPKFKPIVVKGGLSEN
jgi:hypothetical protein